MMPSVHAKTDSVDAIREQKFTDPFYWAGFVLIGDTFPIYPFRLPTRITVAIGLLVLLAGGLIIMGRSGLRSGRTQPGDSPDP